MAILGHQNCHAKPIGTPRNTEIQLTKGASIYDVHTEGRGGHKIPQICGQTVGKIRTGGQKFADVIYGAPNYKLSLSVRFAVWAFPKWRRSACRTARASGRATAAETPRKREWRGSSRTARWVFVCVGTLNLVSSSASVAGSWTPDWIRTCHEFLGSAQLWTLQNSVVTQLSRFLQPPVDLTA